MKQISRNWRYYLGLYYDRFFEDQCTRLAASLAYSTLLTLVPLFIVVFAVLSWFPWFHGVGNAVQHFILNTFIPSSASVISAHLDTFVAHMRALTWARWVIFLAASILMVYNLVGAFNRIWHVGMRRHFTLSFLLYALIMIVAPIVIGALFFISPYVNTAILIVEKYTHIFLQKPLLVAFPYIVSWLTFVFFNWYIPNAKVKASCAVIAGTVTMVLFELAKFGFSRYVTHFSFYHVLYGALSVIPLFLIWLYLSWLIILGGVLLCHLLMIHSGR